ncbi:hypothetical protein [Roseobacter litoralis]|uniref:hypothetical protein n=1 Tax=Roseobacter litoralis TaxID=42443 RepID=UPI0024954BA7|nr:hypothetical protein [Roseobacter litoralis]
MKKPDLNGDLITVLDAVYQVLLMGKGDDTHELSCDAHAVSRFITGDPVLAQVAFAPDPEKTTSTRGWAVCNDPDRHYHPRHPAIRRHI